MAKPPDSVDWEASRNRIIGLGERSFHKSYYPQLRENLGRLERFRTLLDRTTDLVILIALPEMKVADANAALGRFVGEPAEALIGRAFASLGLGDAGDRLEELRRDLSPEALPEPPGHSFISRFDHCGQVVCLEISCRAVSLEGGDYAVLVARDVTEREQGYAMAEALLAEKEALLDNALVGIAMLRERTVVSCNRRFDEIFGYPHGALIGRSTRALYVDDESFRITGESAYLAIKAGQSFYATLMKLRADGTAFWAEMAGRAIDPSRPEAGSIWVFNDVTDRKQAEERAQYLSYHDALTGLPNRLLLQDRFEQAIAFSRSASAKVALMVVDLDRFKTINDFLGHAAGDRLLIEVADRLRRCTRLTDTVSRQGGDEFHLLLSNLAEHDAIVTYLDELICSMEQPFHMENQELTTTVSVGIAIFPEDGSDFETLLKKADMAMYRAKESGRNTYRFFNEGMNSDAVEQITLHAGLRRALDAGQFLLHYQPQFDISSGRLIGAEALVRWVHPELGLISPGRFIPVAEESGLIIQIGDWILHEACREAAKWHRSGSPDLVVAVNLSAVQFRRGNIEQSVANALEEAGLAPEKLELELTESMLIGDVGHVLNTLLRLKQMGVKLSIDDFGTGYSSFAYLKRFSVDTLKIDQSFVRGLAADNEDAAIVRAIIQMAHSLGLRTIAEGVETQEVLDRLAAYGCDEVQGYYCGYPIPAAELLELIASGKRLRMQ